MFVAHNKNKERIISLHSSKESGPFSCPGCESEVVFKKGKIVSAHFAHKKRTDCDSSSESMEHLKMKELVYLDAIKHKVEADLEAPIGASRADVVINNGARKIAVEVQLSNISKEDIEKRHAEHRAHGYETLWLVKKPDERKEKNGQLFVEKWKRNLHEMSNGSLMVYASNLHVQYIHLCGWKYETYKHHKYSFKPIPLRDTEVNSSGVCVPKIRWWDKASVF